MCVCGILRNFKEKIDSFIRESGKVGKERGTKGKGGMVKEGKIERRELTMREREEIEQKKKKNKKSEMRELKI